MLAILLQSFGYGIIHGVLPDEHTWPITFSYAIGNATGKKGIKAGLYFSLAFTLQRALGSEVSYFLLSSWLTKQSLNWLINCLVGAVMLWAGWQIQKRGRYLHVHLLGHHHEATEGLERGTSILSPYHRENSALTQEAFPTRWALIHGFIAGFGVGPFAMFIYTIAAPHMPSPWLGFLPGLLFGLGTMLTLMLLGGIFGSALQTSRRFTASEIQSIGQTTGSLTMLGGGLVFILGGIVQASLNYLNIAVNLENWMIGIITIGVAIPVLTYSIWQVRQCRKNDSLVNAP